MKILFVISNLANGGAERVISVLSNELAKLGDEVHILYFEKNLGFYKYNATLRHLNLYEKRSFLSKFSKFFKIRKSIKDIAPDAIISLMDQTNINVIISTLFLRRTLIISEHTSQSALKSSFWRLARDFLYKFADALVVLNQKEKAYYSFLKNAKIIYNPLFSGDIQPQNTQKQNIILSVGRLEKVKNYEMYLDALSLIDANILSSWRVLIAGSGSQEVILKQKAKDLGLNVEFLGHCEDTSKLYESAKILALPSLSESFGNVLIECLPYSCARIATKTHGACELIIDEQDGILCDFSATDFSQKLSELLQDESLQVSLANNALLKLSEFKADKIAREYKNLINECKK